MKVDRWACVVALCVAFFSCGLVIFVESQARGARAESEGTRMILVELQEAVKDMDSRLTSLERDREQQKERIAPLDENPGRTRGAGLETFAAQIAELQAGSGRTGSSAELGSLTSVMALLSEFKQRDEPGVPRGFPSRARGRKLSPDRITEKQEIICDVTRTDRERLRALRALRSQPLDSTPYSPEVFERLVEWMHLTENPEVRADILRNLHGGEASELKQPILDYLRTDPDPKVREEAADTLEHCLDDPSVRVALNDAREHDSDEKVRKQAGRTLEKMEE